MKTLKNVIKDNLLNKGDEYNKAKESFWASETEQDIFELFHKFKGTPQTNPMSPETALGLGMRKYLELAVIDSFKDAGILVPPPTDGQHRVDFVRNTKSVDIRITGYMDAIIKEDGIDIPVEVKTSFGDYQKYDLDSGKPKTSYLKQLAIYMDFMGVNKGYLFQVHFKDALLIDEIYQFTLERHANGLFQCGEIMFDLQDTYDRWGFFKKFYLDMDAEPDPEFKYKYDLKTIDWKKLPKSKIANARNNKAVIGDWQVLYSSYKDLIIKKQGASLGYSDEELEYIDSQTKGYSTWGK